MPGIGFIRTAMRWRSYSRAMLMVGMIGCVLSTTRFYVPTPGAERISPDQLRDRVHAMLYIECPRLLRGREIMYDAARFTLLMDSTGTVQRAEMSHASGDSYFGDVLGALAARLRVERSPARGDDLAPVPFTVNYSCATVASTVTVQLGTK